MTQIDIVSGFLGAGKTTLILKLLECTTEGKTVIIENEFGDIGIDGELLQRNGYQMFEISTGCICCLMQNDFLETLKTILRDHEPQRVIIEPTGISILSDIVSLLKREPFASSCVVHSLLTVVDCENYLEQKDGFGEFFEDQIANATHLLLSKIQNVRSETIEEIVLSLRQCNKDAPVIAKNWDSFTVAELDGYINGEIMLDYNKEMKEPDKRSCREKRFSTFSLKLQGVVSLAWVEKNLDAMKNGIFGDTLRGKGFVTCEEGSYIFSLTNHLYQIDPFEEEVSGKICFIGIGLDIAGLSKLWSRS